MLDKILEYLSWNKNSLIVINKIFINFLLHHKISYILTYIIFILFYLLIIAWLNVWEKWANYIGSWLLFFVVYILPVLFLLKGYYDKFFLKKYEDDIITYKDIIFKKKIFYIFIYILSIFFFLKSPILFIEIILDIHFFSWELFFSFI